MPQVKMPDGQIVDMPDELTPELATRLKALQAASQPTLLDRFKASISPVLQSAGANAVEIPSNLALGALKGASNIGATLMRPLDATGITGKTNVERRAQLDQFYKDNADTNSLAFKGGELGSELAGTAGAGGLIGKGVGLVAPKIGQAIASGGTSLGAPAADALSWQGIKNAATRIAGGSIAGGASAGLVNPEDTVNGGAVGAAIPVAGKILSTVGGKLAPVIAGHLTGAGEEPIKQAFSAGKNGGSTADIFAANLRGEVPIQDVLQTAKDNLAKLAADKTAAYKAGMANVKNDQTVLKFDGINNALKNASDMVSFKGQVKNEKAAKVVEDIADEIKNWKALNPAEYHTPEGLDALKQKIGGIVDSIPYEEKTARAAGNSVYNSIRSEISKQAPTYSETMKGYTEASDKIREIEKTLSLNPSANVDTSVRKLQSLMRNNVNTNFGNRLNLAKTLEAQGGGEMMPALAGQSLSSLTPRGLQGASASMIGAGGLYMHNPVALPILAAQSPRIVGETAFLAGKAARLAGKAPEGANALSRAATYLSVDKQKAEK